MDSLLGNTTKPNENKAHTPVPPEAMFFNVLPKVAPKIPDQQWSSRTQDASDDIPVPPPPPPKPAPVPPPPPKPAAPPQPRVQSMAEQVLPGAFKDVPTSGGNIGSIIKKFVTTVIVLAILGGIAYAGFSYKDKLQEQLIAFKDKYTGTGTKPPPLPPPPPDETIGTDQENPISTAPKDWLESYFGVDECTVAQTCGDSADPDKDGIANTDELRLHTDPNNPDSDADGIADGDEANITNCDPLKANTAGNLTYNDADDFRGGYDCNRPEGNDDKMPESSLANIGKKIRQYGLHEPTMASMSGYLAKYESAAEAAEDTATSPGQRDSGSDTPLSGSTDASPEGMLERDTQRSATIKKLGVALMKFKTDAGYFPQTSDWQEMIARIKPYNTVATNPTDPINRDPYVYRYLAAKDSQDFTLSYYSETQKQVIKYTSLQAKRDASQESAEVNDDERMRDLESLRSALLIYSSANSAGGQLYVFPPQDRYKTELVPRYISEIPKDPKTSADYPYTVAKDFKSFTLKTPLENPPSGTVGYLCNEEECKAY